METVDLEITQQHTLFGCQLESSFGGRYAEYDGQESAGVVDELHDSLELSGLARATRHLRGAGPTLGLSGRKNLRIGFGKNAGELLPEMDCESCGLETCCGDCGSGERHTHASLGTCTGMVESLGCGLMKVPERLRKPRSITMVVTEVLRRPVLAINR